MNKTELLYQFSRTPSARNCKSIADLEERFSTWLRRNNITLITRGKDYFENNFYSSANYTMKLLKKDRNLLYAFGLDESHLVVSRPDYRDNLDEGYSLGGQFKFYANQVHNRRQDGEYRKSGKNPIAFGASGKVILAIIILVVVYMLVGDTVWEAITSGAIFKLICFGIAGFASYKVLRSKKMGWPLPVKLIVLFVVWLALLNYDF